MKDLTLDQYTDLIRAHQSGLRAFVRSLGVYADAVDDIAQEAFLLAWRKRDRFDPDTDFGRWLRSIARNLAANERRKAVRRSRILSERLSEILDNTVGQEESVELERLPELLDAMRKCVQRLSERSRSLLISRYELDERAPELAARLGTNPGAVRQALARIRKAVRDCIEDKVGMSWT